ncbi:hypothetical protein Cabys_1126 [Caldithrix abyssi DSM 13497]|uniref:Uncharacterized protein n=1 Tax=Caldithrix abyssi DSM 13497 TaxID=880073 RepID=A0A1J1C5B8_CALAY|nr:hypothetical protein Cabys_1126 [Caldithrix abyssi DSM 13497]
MIEQIISSNQRSHKERKECFKLNYPCSLDPHSQTKDQE